MKITQSDYETLNDAMQPIIEKHPFSEYQAAGLSGMRYRWDVFRATGLKLGDGAGMPGDINLYAYLNDEHIDTAFRKITGTK